MGSRERQVKICHNGIACCQTVPGRAVAARLPWLPTRAGCICEDGGACWCPKAKFYPADENTDGWLMLSLRPFHIVSFNEAMPDTHAHLHTALPALLCSLTEMSASFQALNPTDSPVLHIPISNLEQILDFSTALTQADGLTKGLVQTANDSVSGKRKKKRKNKEKKIQKTAKTTESV